MRLRHGAVALPLIVLALLTGCGDHPDAAPSAGAPVTTTPSPTPTPSPTAPAAGDLVLTTTGLGTLEFDVAPSAEPATQMIAVDPAACTEFGETPGSEEASRWRPIAEYGGSASPMFGVVVLDGVLTRIDIFTTAIPTDAGIRIGSSAAELTAAYPSATVESHDLTDVVTVSDAHGTLMIEVARERGLFDTAYWESDQVDRVIYLRGTLAGTTAYTVAASENIAGGCL